MNPNTHPNTDEFPLDTTPPVRDDDTQPVVVPAAPARKGPQPPAPPQTTFDPTYAELKAQLADAQTEAQLLRDLLKETSETLHHARLVNNAQSQIIRDLMDDSAPKLEVCTLMQWLDNLVERARADDELAQHRNQGWRLVDVTYRDYPGAEPDIPNRVRYILLEREVKPAPLSADATTVGEDSVANEEFAQAMGDRIILKSEPLGSVLPVVMQFPPADVLDAW